MNSSPYFTHDSPMGSLQEFFYWILLKFLLVFFQRFLQHSFMDPSGGSFRNFSRDFSRGPPIASSWYSLNDLSQDSIRDILKLPPGFPSWVSRRNTFLIVLGYFREFFRCFSRISSTIFPGFYFGIFPGFFYWSFPRSQFHLRISTAIPLGIPSGFFFWNFVGNYSRHS